MPSHILIATLAAIALSTSAWAHDPAKPPVDTEMKAVLWDPAEEIKAILLDPAEAPIDTEMKILWLENIARALRENTAGGGDVVRSGLGARGAGRTDPTIAEYRSAPTNANVAAE
jgi:hypothetical protein